MIQYNHYNSTVTDPPDSTVPDVTVPDSTSTVTVPPDPRSGGGFCAMRRLKRRKREGKSEL